MKSKLTALALALAFTGGAAFAQQQPSQKTDSSGTASSGPTFTEKVKEAAQNIGEKTKEAAQKMKDKAQQTADKSRDTDVADKDRDTKSSNGNRDGNSAAVQMQKKADAELKSANAKCAAMQDTSQKSICRKQAVATHANAEVRIEKARAADQGSTATMGANKSR